MLPPDSFIKFQYDEGLNENLPSSINIKKEPFDPNDEFHNLMSPSKLAISQTDNSINIKTEPASIQSLQFNNTELFSESLSSKISDAKVSVGSSFDRLSTSIIKCESIDIKDESHGESDTTTIITDFEGLITIKDESYGKLEDFTQNECFTQSGNNFCNICGKNFVNIYTPLIVIILHEKNTKYLCKICNKTFSRKGHLKNHEKIIHLKIGDWKCSFCDKFFPEKARLKVHEKSVHLKIRDWKCNVCDMYFTQKFI